MSTEAIEQWRREHQFSHMINMRPITKVQKSTRELLIAVNIEWQRQKLIGRSGDTMLRAALLDEHARLFPPPPPLPRIAEMCPPLPMQTLLANDAERRGYRFYVFTGIVFDLNHKRICGRGEVEE